jgi:hypothetical protein
MRQLETRLVHIANGNVRQNNQHTGSLRRPEMPTMSKTGGRDVGTLTPIADLDLAEILDQILGHLDGITFPDPAARVDLGKINLSVLDQARQIIMLFLTSLITRQPTTLKGLFGNSPSSII